MNSLHFNTAQCDLCGQCIKSCPFHALSIKPSIETASKHSKVSSNENCRICGVCIRVCPQKAISLEQKSDSIDKSKWNDFLIYAEQELGEVHPVTYELIGEARKLAKKAGYSVKCVIVGGKGTVENAQKLLSYGVDEVLVYEHQTFTDFRVDCYADAVANCIEITKPSSVLIGSTSVGRSIAPRLATRFHTGLTADCTILDIKDNTDMIQIRPAFGGNIMAQILITNSRPQFATVRYHVMDKADKTEPLGKITKCDITPDMIHSDISVLSSHEVKHENSIEEADIIIVAGRGIRNEKDLLLCQSLADSLGGQLAYTRPMIENGFGDTAHQIGLSGRTVRPKLLIACGVSGAIQFTSCITGAECIVAINSDAAAPIFQSANYCIVDDLYKVIPELLACIKNTKEVQDGISL